MFVFDIIIYGFFDFICNIALFLLSTWLILFALQFHGFYLINYIFFYFLSLWRQLFFGFTNLFFILLLQLGYDLFQNGCLKFRINFLASLSGISFAINDVVESFPCFLEIIQLRKFFTNMFVFHILGKIAQRFMDMLHKKFFEIFSERSEMRKQS